MHDDVTGGVHLEMCDMTFMKQPNRKVRSRQWFNFVILIRTAAAVSQCCKYEMKAYDCASGAFENTELEGGREEVESQLESSSIVS